MKYLSEIFDDWLIRAAGVIFVLIVIFTVFSVFSNIADTHPLVGVFIYSMVPILFIAGGVVFVLAILRS